MVYSAFFSPPGAPRSKGRATILLFDVSAVLLTSVLLAGVTGVVGAPANAAEGVSATTDPVPAARSELVSADAFGAGRASAEMLPRLGGRALLDQLALLPTEDVASFVDAHPGSVEKILADPPSAASVRTWWRAVPRSARHALLRGAPGLVGNLDGVTSSVRDAGNRAYLRAAIAEAERELPALGRAEHADAEQRLHMLREIEESLVTAPGQPERTLLSVDTAWPGRAAVVVGDLDTADYVSWMVPGMFFTVDGQIVDWTVICQDLYDEQASWVDRLGRDDPALADASVAVVSWIGYRTPGIADIASLDLAHDGAKYISSAVHGLEAVRSGDDPYVTLVTHSYGSTATMMALQDGDVTADALVLIGSPGSAAQSVRDIGMPSDRVFVGEAAWDPVVNSAFFGSDPGSAGFGAEEMPVAGGEDPITGRELAAATGHLGYFDAGTEAMRNMALVGLDRGDLVTGIPEGLPTRQLAER